MLRKDRKQQSAMEYLMTYGWSILIIAIVLAALFSLGMFSNSNLGPRAQPNNCRVFRPNGPLTTQNINLEGTCNVEAPEYVATFDGATSYVHLSSYPGFPAGSAARSVFAWVKSPFSGGSTYAVLAYGTSATDEEAVFYISSAGAVGFDGDHDAHTAFSMSPNTWYFVGYTYAAGSSQVTLYLNGQAQTASLSGVLNTIIYSPDPADIGRRADGISSYWYNGLISDVQIYNTTMDPSAINSLYLEGIGGVPVEPQYLVGWWPLNGDTNDYSGNNNNGAATNIVFGSSWTSGYTIP